MNGPTKTVGPPTNTDLPRSKTQTYNHAIGSRAEKEVIQ